MTGSFENKYDSTLPFTSNGYDEAVKKLERLLKLTKDRINNFNETTPDDIRNNTEIDEMIFEKELKELSDALEETQRDNDTVLPENS